MAGDPDQGGGLARSGGGRDEGPPTSPDGGQPPRSGEQQGAVDSAAGRWSRTSTSARVGRIAVLFVAVLFGVFALVNSQPVDFSWIFGETTVEPGATGETTGGIPLIVLLLVSFILGAALGGWWTWQAARTRQRRRDRPGE
jgi:uncharacterized integral membrane protein